jgi:hypothetical protein
MDNLSKPVKVLLGIGSLWPMIYIFVFAFGFGLFFFLAAAQGSTGHMDGAEPPAAVIAAMVLFLAMHIGTIFPVWGMLVFFIIHLVQTIRVPNDQKALWAVILFLGAMIAMPVYWYMYIWREPSPPREAVG